MSRWISVIVFACLITASLCAEESRKWRVKREGRTLTLEGQYLGVRNGCVQLKLTTGVVIGVYQVSEFSEADVAYMREATQRMQAEALQKQQAQAETLRPAKAEAPANGGEAKKEPQPEAKKTPSWALKGPSEDEDIPGEASPEVVEAEYLRVAKKCGFEILYDPVLPSGEISGRAVSREEIKPLLGQFFTAIDIFPVRFLKRTGLDTVVFCHDLKLRGVPAGGVASGNVIYLASSFNSHVVYHELYHVADPSRENTKWTKLNDKKFAYGGSKFDPAEGNKRQIERAAAAREDAGLRGGFVSDYAMSSEVEDRAETFAFRVANPKVFAEQCKTSSVLTQKEALVKDMVRDFSPAMNKDFWVFIAESNDETRLAEFLKRAKINDARKHQKKSLINSGYKN